MKLDELKIVKVIVKSSKKIMQGLLLFIVIFVSSLFLVFLMFSSFIDNLLSEKE